MQKTWLIIGQSGHGKSEYAEKIAIEKYLENKKEYKDAKLYYVATMTALDEETTEKIKIHRERREDTAFITIEKPYSVGMLDFKVGDVVLLECLSNLLANEMYYEKGIGSKKCVDYILGGINHIAQKADLVIVSNEINVDGIDYDMATREYINNLSKINIELARTVDFVKEVVVGIPIDWRK